MGGFTRTIAKCFSAPVQVREADELSPSPAPKTSPFNANDHAYYVNRVNGRMLKNYRDNEEAKRKAYEDEDDYYHDNIFRSDPEFAPILMKLSLSTLVMINEHLNSSEIELHDLQSLSESNLRSSMHMASLCKTKKKKDSLFYINAAFLVMRDHHDVPADTTTLTPEHAVMVSAACDFLIQSALFNSCPPRLTALVMERADSVDSVLSYLETHQITHENVHHIDVANVESFLDTPAQSLRDGML